MYLKGTYGVLPKGNLLPKSREVGALIGPFVSIEQIDQLVAGMPKSEAYRLVASTIKHMVENLRDGVNCHLNIAEARLRWQKESREAELAEQTL